MTDNVSSKAAEKPAKKPAKASKPSQPLPSGRIAFDKQTDLLRAWGMASGPERKAVTNKVVADIIGMNESTSFQLNTFLQEIGFLSRGDGGLVASPDLVAYASAFKWGDADAAQKLAPTFGASWFGKALLPRLGFRPIEEKQAMLDLAATAGVDPEYRSPIKMCIDYLEFAGLVERDGGMLKEGQAAYKIGFQQIPAPKPLSPEVLDALTQRRLDPIAADADVSAEGLTRLLKRKPSKKVQDAIWTLIRFLTIGEETLDDDQGGEP